MVLLGELKIKCRFGNACHGLGCNFIEQ